jgi:hypothetical protein
MTYERRIMNCKTGGKAINKIQSMKLTKPIPYYSALRLFFESVRFMLKAHTRVSDMSIFTISS